MSSTMPHDDCIFLVDLGALLFCPVDWFVFILSSGLIIISVWCVCVCVCVYVFVKNKI